MRTSIYMLLIALMVVGCSPQKRLGKLLLKYPIPPEITYTKGPIEYKDTTIIKYLPGETITEILDLNDLLSTVECPEIPDIKPVHAETSLASVDVWVDEGKLKVRLIQHDSIFQFHLDNAIRENSDTVWIDRIVLVDVKVKPKDYSFYKSGFFIFLGLIIIIITLLLVFIKKK